MDKYMNFNRCHAALGACAALFITLSIGVPGVAYGEPGDGVQAGNYNLSFGLRLTSSYNSNLFSQSEDASVAPGALSIPLTLSAKLATVKPRLVDTSLAWSGTGAFFVSDREATRDQSGFSTQLKGTSIINKEGNASLFLEQLFTRTNEAANWVGAESINRIINRSGATLGIHPGGQVLKGFLSYAWQGFFYNDFYDDLDKHEHLFALRTAYQFLPRTAFYLNTDFRLIRYDDPVRGLQTGNTLPNSDSTPLRINGGLNGLVLRNLNVHLGLGYGWAFYDIGESFDGLLADAVLQYYIGPQQNTTFIAGYQRSFDDSPIGNASVSDTFKLGVDQSILNKEVVFSLLGSLEFRDIMLPPAATDVILADGSAATLRSEIDDTIANVSLGVNWNPTKWLDIGAAYKLRGNFTDTPLFDTVNPTSNISEITGT